MLPHHFQRFDGASPESTQDILESHQLTYDFYRELKHRQAFAEHCQWYREMAQQNQRELEKINRGFSWRYFLPFF